MSDVCFGGQVNISLQKLRPGHSDTRRLSPESLGLTLDRATDLADIPAINELRMTVFTDEPERCWFYRNPGVAEHFEGFTIKRLTSGRQWKIQRDGTILGFFGYGIFESPMFGRSASMDFAVHRSLHGRGLGRLAYEIMLSQMTEDGIEYFSGSTANPAVIHLSRLMGRAVQHFEIGPKNRCPDASLFAEELNLLEG